MITTTKKALITMPVVYHTGMGGTHATEGWYRVNPITGAKTFSPWLGLGTFCPSGGRSRRTVQETVCATCGGNQTPDPWGHRPLCNCEGTGTSVR